jgi:hypothetical protein
MRHDSTLVTGSLRAFLLFEIADEVDVLQLRRILGSSPETREPVFRHPAPDYVKFERTPVLERLGMQISSRGEQLQASIRYFDYGVASVELSLQFATSWDDLLRLANRWILSSDLEAFANSLLQTRINQILPALAKPHNGWISEEYYVIQLNPMAAEGRVLSAEELVQEYGSGIAQMVRGEETALSKHERQEVLHSSLSYYPSDLLVVGWIAAFIYDDSSAAAPTVGLLEYANTQLLEFRYYDEVLTRVLADVYKQLERRRRWWERWKLVRQAERLNTVRLDYRELSERTENAIKFLSDMFYARAYRLAASRIGVNDYRDLVAEKLQTARELYDSMVNGFNESRAFFLECVVVVILIIEIVFLFRGKG